MIVRRGLAAAPPMAGTDARLRVAIVEDDRTTREGLAMLIDGSRDCRCVGAYRSVEQALQSAGGPGVDVILLDIHLPGMRHGAIRLCGRSNETPPEDIGAGIHDLTQRTRRAGPRRPA